MSSSSSSSSKHTINAVFDFVKGGNLQPSSKPGFAHGMQLSYNTMNRANLSWDADRKALIYRYKFDASRSNPADLKVASLNPKLSLGTMTAIMDELSTNACFAVGQPSAPGLSLHMNMEWLVQEPIGHILRGGQQSTSTAVATANADDNDDAAAELDVVNVVSKLGKTVSFTRTEYVHPDTKQVLALGTHVKYMPTGSSFLDLVFSKAWAFQLYRRFFQLETVIPPTFDSKPLVKDTIGDHLQHTGLGKATFHITKDHTNPFGGLHGGCHAMLMELVALPLASSELSKKQGNARAESNGSSTYTYLKSQKIDYLSAGRTGQTIFIEADVIDVPTTPISGGTIPMRVTLSRQDGRVLSDGTLVFASADGVSAGNSKL